ncbi:MAG: DNA polymerase III subunit alpha [Pyrinomonadaceae bacterium]
MGPISFKPRDFVHLHLHSDYSLLQSTIQLKPLAAKLKELEMSACALTDYGNMFGAVSFYSAMAEAGIRPIIGYEAFVASSRLANGTETHATGAGERPFYNLVLLARDLTGYHNLVRLASIAYSAGSQSKPRIDLDLLSEFSAGLIAICGGRDSALGHHLGSGNEERAIEYAGSLKEIFGPESLYFELVDHGLEEHHRLNARLIELAARLGTPLVASNDAKYLDGSDARAHEVMMCIGEGRTVIDGGRPRTGTTDQYLRSAEEMWALFGSEIPEALTNTLEIAQSCDVRLPIDDKILILPNFPIPEDSGCGTLAEYFEKCVATGFEERRSSVLEPLRSADRLKYPIEEYKKRLDREVEVIESMGYEGYFLVVWDFIRYATERGIPVGPGRGSAAGSLVAYVLGITGIDPLQYDLLFERFLNPERVSMPDIDIDFCIRGRSEVIEHVTALYGRESVCQIITFGTMASKAAIKDVGRALNKTYGEVERIAKLIPPPVRGRNVSISKAIEQVEELRSLIEKDASVRDLIDLAMRLEGCSRHTSVHAAGVVISPKPLHELVPVAVSAKNELTSQYSMNDLEKVGMLKMDFLALTTLTIISDCISSIRDRLGVEIDWNEIPLNDEKTMSLFAEGRTDAVFQFESSGMQEICRRLRPKELEDLSALNALYRPGPIDGGMIEDFIQRHRGDKQVRYLVPEMKDILCNTFGVLVYQEQIMQLAQKLAGYSLGEADMMRRAMGKKKREAMAKEEKKFVEGAVSNGIAKAKAQEIFKLMAQFADYGFNRSHSIAYAYLAFQTGYLKAHYPAFFFSAVLSHESDDSAKIYKYSKELRSLGLELLPPDINESGEGFTPSEGAVRFGLTAIKGIGLSTVSSVIAARETGPFASLLDFVTRVEPALLNKRVMESLITSGSFDSLKPEGMTSAEWRSRLFASIDESLAVAQRKWNDLNSGQTDLFSSAAAGDEHLTYQLQDAAPWSVAQISRFEKSSLGFFLTAHPLDEYRDTLGRLGIRPIADQMPFSSGDLVTLAGIVSGSQTKYSKKGNRFGMFSLEDRSAGAKCLMWSEAYSKFASLVLDDAVVIVEGRVETADASELTVIVSGVRSLVDAEAGNARRLVIGLPDERVSDEFLFDLFSSLSETPGSCEVSFEVPVGGKVAVELETRALRVKGSAALQSALTGRGCTVSWRL